TQGYSSAASDWYKRQKYAQTLEQKLTKELEDLEMKGTYFKVDFEQVECSRKGFDAVKFMFSANQGQELKDLHKTASGGELSRLLLAFKNVMLDKEKVQTVVFDEIDSGISGLTAGKVAEKLSNISKYTQVICITHTPVVASKSDAFLLVEKKIVDGNTISTARSLNQNEAINEVARLIDGGNEVSVTAVEHAKKLFS
ncbi:MAG: DNA repair protein RecN, partial [Clostridia bacterium]|nr:DNA repair protein RecN [Clostridia bacterium]